MKKLYFLFAAVIFTAVCAITFILDTSYDKAQSVSPLSPKSVSFPERTDKLMIVAHPDDETIWGGAHLLDENWLVVCLTHGSDITRSSEFTEAVSMSGNTPLMLDYPDKVNLSRDDWSQVSDMIEKDICTLLQLKNWQEVATHNPAGEYGHIHHKLTNALVTQAFSAYGSGTLYYFGDYYSAKKLPASKNDLTQITKDKLEQKLEICSVYRSQKRTVSKLEHMLPYEEWKEADVQ